MNNGFRALLKSLPLTWNCRFLSDAPCDKFSGGFYRYPAANSQDVRWSHSYFAFIYLLDGGGVFTDHKGREFNAVPGSLMLRYPDKEFSIRREPPEWFEFASAAPPSLYKWLLAAKVVDEETSFFMPGLSAAVIARAQVFVNSLADFGDAENSAASCVAYLELFRQLLALSRQQRVNDSFREKGERAKQILSGDLDKDIAMPSVAAKLGLGYELFRKKFAAEYGVSPMEYRIRRRLEKADSLLLHSSLSIKEVSRELGYPNDSDFIRQYRRRRNISPGDFRKSKYI